MDYLTSMECKVRLGNNNLRIKFLGNPNEHGEMKNKIENGSLIKINYFNGENAIEIKGLRSND